MLSIQNIHLSETSEDSELVHAGTARQPRKKSPSRWGLLGAGAVGLGAAGAGAYLLGRKPSIRKKLGKLTRNIRTKIASRVRIIKRGSNPKVVKAATRTTHGPAGLTRGLRAIKNKKFALARSKGLKRVNVSNDVAKIKARKGYIFSWTKPTLIKRRIGALSGKGNRLNSGEFDKVRKVITKKRTPSRIKTFVRSAYKRTTK